MTAYSEKMTKKAAQLERAAEMLAEKAQALERSGEQLAALELWTRKAPTARRPRFTREEIARTAIDIADEEGFDAVSMRRLAAELQSGTMTLYHYVRTKDELLSLVVDAVMGEIVVPDEVPTDWRDALTMISERTRDALVRHPWILDITDDPPLGPNAVRHFDQSMQAVASLPISLSEKIDICGAVDSYVFGFCLHERNNAQGDRHGIDESMMQYVNELIETGDYGQLAALKDEYGLEALWTEIQRSASDPERFERGLTILLDGFAVQHGFTSN